MTDRLQNIRADRHTVEIAARWCKTIEALAREIGVTDESARRLCVRYDILKLPLRDRRCPDLGEVST